MTWATDLEQIRYLLRDPTGKIWTDEFLRHTYNDVQKLLQHETSILEGFAIQRVPGTYHFSYMHDWEHQHLSSNLSAFYQCLSQHSGQVFCHRWEPQSVVGIDADVTDYGVHFTQPWEAFMGQTPAQIVRMRFPSNMRNLKFIAYDEEPICTLSRKRVQSTDSAHMTVSGQPIGYYEVDEVDGEYVLYPRPSSSFSDELDGNEGPAWYIEDDTEDVTTGTIGVRQGTTENTSTGVPFDITDVSDNMFLIYDIDPAEMQSAADDGDYPEFLKKYIRYGVVSRAYGANTDGRIRSLSEYWQGRFLQGIRNIKKYRGNIRQDRVYRLTTKDRSVSGRRHRHPRLPSTYPAVNP